MACTFAAGMIQNSNRIIFTMISGSSPLSFIFSSAVELVRLLARNEPSFNVCAEFRCSGCRRLGDLSSSSPDSSTAVFCGSCSAIMGHNISS